MSSRTCDAALAIPRVAEALDRIYGGLEHAPAPTTFVVGSAVLQGCLPLLMEEMPVDTLLQTVGKRKYEKWRALYRQSTLLNLWYGRELKSVLQTLTEADIPVIVLKGADLAASLYPHPGLRHYGDVDLMVHPQHLEDTLAILRSSGYNYHQEYRFESISKQRTAYVYVKEVDGGYIVLEIHTSPHRNEMGVSFDIPGLWKRARPITIEGVAVCGMGLEDLLLYLCWHFRSHTFDRLIWLYDISIVLLGCANQLDWSLVYDLARKLKLRSTIYYCLLWSEKIFHVSLPERALLARFIPPRIVQKLIERSGSHDLVSSLKHGAGRERRLLQRLMVDTSWQLVGALVRAAYPSPTHLGRLYAEKYPLPVRLFWLLYVPHPFFLLRAFFDTHQRQK